MNTSWSSCVHPSVSLNIVHWRDTAPNTFTGTQTAPQKVSSCDNNTSSKINCNFWCSKFHMVPFCHYESVPWWTVCMVYVNGTAFCQSWSTLDTFTVCLHSFEDIASPWHITIYQWLKLVVSNNYMENWLCNSLYTLFIHLSDDSLGTVHQVWSALATLWWPRNGQNEWFLIIICKNLLSIHFKCGASTYCFIFHKWLD